MTEKIVDTTVEEYEGILRSGYRAIIREADEFRPLAQYVHDVVRAAVEQEREACARIADAEVPDRYTTGDETAYVGVTARTIAAAIRARE